MFSQKLVDFNKKAVVLHPSNVVVLFFSGAAAPAAEAKTKAEVAAAPAAEAKTKAEVAATNIDDAAMEDFVAAMTMLATAPAAEVATTNIDEATPEEFAGSHSQRQWKKESRQ